MGKVQKIKEWISKTQDGLMNAQGNFEYPEHEGAYHILCNLDAYIDSLQEEPVSIWHDASEKPERDDLLIETNDGRIIHRQSINNYGMVKRWAYTSALLNLDNSCNLGNNSQEEPVSEDLGYYINELSKQFQEVSFAKLSRIAVRVAKWQKEQMMKGATEAIVKVDAGGYPYIPQIELYDYDKDVPLAKEGEKYKVILIKEE